MRKKEIVANRPDNFDKLPKTGGMPIFDLLAGVLLVIAGIANEEKKKGINYRRYGVAAIFY